MFTLLVTPPDPRRKNIKNWALPEPNELIICMQGDFDMAIHILMGAVGATKKLKKYILKTCFFYLLGGVGWGLEQ